MPFRQYIRKRDQRGEYWGGQSFEEHLSLCESQLTTDLLLECLPEDGLVLEAGCGLARWVVFLRKRAFKVFGVDVSPETLEAARRHAADAPLVASDVLLMPFKDEAFAAVLSFGVVEHLEEMLPSAFQEMRRVLKKDGLLFLAVPCVNPLRRIVVHPYILVRNLARRIRGVELVFDEYRYSRNDVRRLMVQNGFEPLRIVPDDLKLPYAMGLCRDFRGRFGNPEKFELNRLGLFVERVLRKLSPWISCGGVLCMARRGGSRSGTD